MNLKNYLQNIFNAVGKSGYSLPDGSQPFDTNQFSFQPLDFPQILKKGNASGPNMFGITQPN